MFKLTPNLKIFSTITIIMTIAFHWLLTSFLEATTYTWIIPLAIGYAALMFANGWINGSREQAFATRIDLGFAYHLMTIIVVMPIWLYFAWIRMNAHHLSMWVETTGMVSWLVGLLIHYLISRSSIKGYDRKEVFD